MAVNSFPVSQNVGTVTYGPVAVPDGLTTVKLGFANWASANTLAVACDLSLDGGSTWNMLIAMNPTPGNRSVGRDGTADCSVIVGPMPQVAGRQLRARVTVAGGSISTLLTVTTS